MSWNTRKSRLQELLKSRGDEDEDGLALDRLLHGHSVIGKTGEGPRTNEIESIRLQDSDFRPVGTLDYGQFGAIDVVNCRLNGRVYVRKTIDKKFALRMREQCSPQVERDILARANVTKSHWSPHLLCAYQTQSHLKFVMEYAEGGTLWDVLESSPLDGRVAEADIRWWAPQIVSAVHWCHSQGYVHRDIKPHNFVLRTNGHLLLIDFGTAAELLPPALDGSQRLPKKHCLVPCGTCDYISPEILRAHELALVALELDDEIRLSRELNEDEAYGRETDWWSVGAMLYEMTFGITPFFAEDIRTTYAKIIDSNRYIRFKAQFTISSELQHFINGLLKDAEFRLGRHSVSEITSHQFFRGVEWSNLWSNSAPSNLHVPQFTYADPNANISEDYSAEQNDSKPFAFSELFQSSIGSSPAISILRDVATPRPTSDDTTSAFIGFSWGPTSDAFPDRAPASQNPAQRTPLPPRLTPMSLFSTPAPLVLTTPVMNPQRFSTPMRPANRTPFQTLSRNSTVRRTGVRMVSDREAMKQLVDCVGMSARKKVLDSGRKPRILSSFTRSRASSFKELRFNPMPNLNKIPVNGTDTEEDTDMDIDAPPSPSPSPRPGSAMSRRSGTPTVTGTFSRIMIGEMSQRTGTDASLRVGGDSSRPILGDFSPTFRPSPLQASTSGTTLDELQRKHVVLMRNIHSLEQRLQRLASSVQED
ncbi:kinase-like domain-containing protein [Mucidula mucida]|nr:kinase-like domain-containing protein [Mucidula mucida]